MLRRSLTRAFSTQGLQTCTLLSCVPGKEFLLTKELTQKLEIDQEEVSILKPGIVQIPVTSTSSSLPDLTFALQAFPSGHFHATVQTVDLDFSLPHIVTHAVVPKHVKGDPTRSAVNNRCENLLKSIIKKHSQPKRKFISPQQLSWYRSLPVHLLQVLSLDKSNFFVSLGTPEQVGRSHWPSLYRAGLQDIHFDLPTAPNSAYRKLQEAFCMLGRYPKSGDYVVDVGGSPGGFASLLLYYNTHVLSIDKAKLDVKDPHLTFRQADAFRLEPPFEFHDGVKKETVDWMTWDVICTPERLLEVLQKVCEGRWCENFVGMMKFQGDVNFEAITAVETLAAKHGYTARVKHLFNNKNECTVLLSRV